MKPIGSTAFYFLISILIFPTPCLFSQTNTLKGSLSITIKSQKKRISRSNSYRNRVKGDVESNEFQLKSDHFSGVIVSLKPLNFNPKVLPLKNAKIFQKDKSFSPNLIAVTVGTTVQFINQDDFYHNVFSLTPKSRFNIGRRPAGSSNGAEIKKLGIIQVFCDIHPQMKATIISLDTPYFTTVSSNGFYILNDLPDGKYQIEIYISEHKSIFQTIDLKNEETLISDFILDKESMAFIENNSYRLIADVTCCKNGVMCKNSVP